MRFLSGSEAKGIGMLLGNVVLQVRTSERRRCSREKGWRIAK